MASVYPAWAVVYVVPSAQTYYKGRGVLPLDPLLSVLTGGMIAVESLATRD